MYNDGKFKRSISCSELLVKIDIVIRFSDPDSKQRAIIRTCDLDLSHLTLNVCSASGVR